MVNTEIEHVCSHIRISEPAVYDTCRDQSWFELFTNSTLLYSGIKMKSHLSSHPLIFFFFPSLKAEDCCPDKGFSHSLQSVTPSA